MKKSMSLVLCVVLLLTLFAFPVSASPANAQVTIKNSPTAPVTDGVVNPGEYGEKIHSVDYSSDEFLSAYDTDKSIQADFYMTWTEERLYIAWVVYTDGHWPIPANYDHGNGTGGMGYMYMFSCIQFMLSTGAPDVSKKVYQTATWSGNYIEAGLSVMADGSSLKVLWSKPVGAENFTANSWDFAGIRDNSNNTTTYEISLSFIELGITNVGAGTQFGFSYSIGDQENFTIAPNMCEWQDAILGGKNMDAGAVITLSDETIDGSIMGKPLADPAYIIAVSAPDEYIPGQIIEVEMTLRDIKAESGYGLVQLLLYYDAEKVEPVVKNDGDNNDAMEAFLVSAPSLSSWEGLSKLEEQNSRYDIAFMTTEKDAHAKTDGSVVIRVAFKVKQDATGDIRFQVPHTGTTCADYNLKKHYGNADSVTVTKKTVIDYLGTLIENPGYTLAVTAPEKYEPGKELEVTITIKDITDTGGLSLVHFILYYDSELAEPVIKNDGDQNLEMQSFLKVAPDLSKWESISKLEEDKARYNISFLTAIKTSLAKTDGSVVIKIPFMIKDNAEREIFFYIPHSESYCMSFDFVNYFGNGSLALLTMGSGEEEGIVPLEGSGLEIDEDNAFLTGMSAGTKVAQLKNMFKGSISILNKNRQVAAENTLIGTGFIITDGEREITVVLLGDGNGDGIVDAKDYLLAKRAFLGTYSLTGAYNSALCLSGDSTPTAKDYLKIKRHFLGTFNLFA